MANGETERLELFGPPQLEHVNVFYPPPPPPNDAFIIKPYSHPPLSALLACLLLAPLAVEETITYVNIQVEVIQSVITSLENITRQLKRVFVQLADTQKSGVSRRRKLRPRERQNRGKKREKGWAKLQSVVQFLTGESAEEVILRLSDGMICLQNTDSLDPTVLVKGLDQLISEGGLSVGVASEIQTYLTSKSIE